MNCPDVAIVGAGVIGLSVAWKAAAAGFEVSVFESAEARSASFVAGGMLAPVTEAWPGDEPVLRLGAESLARWPEFAERLSVEGGDPGLSTAGTVVVGLDNADAETLRTLADYLHRLGREATLVRARELRNMVRGLSGSVRNGLFVQGDLAVDNRQLLDSLRCAARQRGVHFINERVKGVERGVVQTTSRAIGCGTTVIAAGAWSALLHPRLRNAVRPLKGEILRLRARKTSLPPPKHTVRAMDSGRPIYLVPRRGAEVVLGATQYEAGYDETVTAGGIRQLIEGAERVFPSIAEYELIESRAGSRSASIDNLPFIGELDDAILAATGHHRNGLLLAPVTADAIVSLLTGGVVPEEALMANPHRLVSEVS